VQRRRATRADQYRDSTYIELLERIAGNVRRLRRLRKWTQEEAAHRCEMAPRVLQFVEAGTENLTVTTLPASATGSK
jgi:hypothetical protein